MEALEVVLWVVGAIVVVALLWRGAPFFQAIFERRDRDTVIDNKVITPPSSASTEEIVQEAEEDSEIDEHGLTTE
ncbi:MAG: hypothetical protein M3220_08700 [Chloroflexota bacterium]|nr:hypothetical protein [Chloroflexota bacterium]